MKCIALLCWTLLLMTIASAQTPPNFEQVKRDFKTFYEQQLRQHGIVGSSFLLIYDNQIVDKNFYGLAHREQNLLSIKGFEHEVGRAGLHRLDGDVLGAVAGQDDHRRIDAVLADLAQE